MKRLCVSMCIVLIMCMVLTSGVSAVYTILTVDELETEFEAGGLNPMWPSMHMEDNVFFWKGQSFETAWKSKVYNFKRSYPTESLASDSLNFRVTDSDWGITASNIRLSDITDGNEYPTLTFDYTAVVDLDTNNTGETAYDAMLVAFYHQIADTAGTDNYVTYYENNRSGIIQGTFVGYQFVKFVPAGTAGGEEEFSAGMDVTIELPKNFDPSMYAIGLAIWRVEDAPILREGYPMSYLVSPGVDTSYINLVNLSPFVESFEVWTDSNTKPEPPIKAIMGDANADGVINLADISVTLKYIMGWDVYIESNLADINGNSRADLEDVSSIMKIIAGWEL